MTRKETKLIGGKTESGNDPIEAPSLLYAQIQYKPELRRAPPNSPGQPRVPDKECTALTVTFPASYKDPVMVFAF